MITCSKCKVEKTDDNYQTYWHSTQQKMRTRKVCKFCYNKQKKLYKESIRNKKIIQPEPPELEIQPVIDYSNHPDYRQCNTCNEFKVLTDYYLSNGKPTSYRCIKCTREKEKYEASLLMEAKGGSDMVPKLPNRYFDEYQRKNTFELMRLFGYIYDEKTGIWTKSGWKEIKDGKPFFPNLKKKEKKKKENRPKFIPKVTPEFYQKIKEYTKKGLKRSEIADLLNVSITTVRNTIIKYERS